MGYVWEKKHTEVGGETERLVKKKQVAIRIQSQKDVPCKFQETSSSKLFGVKIQPKTRESFQK